MISFKYNEKESNFEYDGSPEAEAKTKADMEIRRANPSPGQKNMMEMFKKIENIKKSFQNIPLSEYVDILKYKQIVTLENLSLSNDKIKLLLLLSEQERIHIFETVKITTTDDNYSLSMGFSDYIKCSLLTNIQRHLRLTPDEVYTIGSLLSFDIKRYSITKDGAPVTQDFIKQYLDHYPSLDILLRDNLFDLSYLEIDDFLEPSEYEIHKDPKKAYTEFIEQFETKIDYIKNNKFEKAIYHIIAYDKSIFIPLRLNLKNPKIEEKLSYCTEDTISYEIINATYISSINSFIEFSTIELPRLDFGKTADNFHLLHGFFGLKRTADKRRGHYMYKEKSLKENALSTIKNEYHTLQKNKSDNIERTNGLGILIERIETELELGNYSLEEYKKILDIEDNTTKIKENSEAYIPLMGNIKEFMKHLGAITEGTLQTEIKNKTIEKVEVFRKENSKTQKELREEYPFAEIGGQQHDGKHRYSTVRYKKSLKK